MIDNESPQGSWRKALRHLKRREEKNAAIIALNSRIRKRFNKGEALNLIAAQEGVSIAYVTQMSQKWGG